MHANLPLEQHRDFLEEKHFSVPPCATDIKLLIFKGSGHYW